MASKSAIIFLFMLQDALAQVNTSYNRKTFLTQSMEQNTINSVGKIGLVVGFVMFGIFYITAVARVFADINASKEEYEQ